MVIIYSFKFLCQKLNFNFSFKLLQLQVTYWFWFNWVWIMNLIYSITLTSLSLPPVTGGPIRVLLRHKFPYSWTYIVTDSCIEIVLSDWRRTKDIFRFHVYLLSQPFKSCFDIARSLLTVLQNIEKVSSKLFWPGRLRTDLDLFIESIVPIEQVKNTNIKYEYRI